MSDNAELERNKAVALRFKKSQGTQDMPQVEKEVLAPQLQPHPRRQLPPRQQRARPGLAAPGMYLRTAFPDRVDVIEEVVAEGDTVGLLFRLNATHAGNLFGIPPTGKKIDVYEIALLRIVNGQMVEGWFMMDEAELLRQLGAKMPVRKDGRIIAPPVPELGESADAHRAALRSKPPQRPHKAILARSRASAPAPAADRAPDFARKREAFQHLHDWGVARGKGERDPAHRASATGATRSTASSPTATRRGCASTCTAPTREPLRPAAHRQAHRRARGGRLPLRRRQVEGELVLRRRAGAAAAAGRAQPALRVNG